MASHGYKSLARSLPQRGSIFVELQANTVSRPGGPASCLTDNLPDPLAPASLLPRYRPAGPGTSGYCVATKILPLWGSDRARNCGKGQIPFTHRLIRPFDRRLRLTQGPIRLFDRRLRLPQGPTRLFDRQIPFTHRPIRLFDRRLRSSPIWIGPSTYSITCRTYSFTSATY